MKKWSFGRKFLVFLIVGFIAVVIIRHFTKGSEAEPGERISKNEILRLDIDGVIMNGKKFLKNLKRYKNDDTVKAFVIDINSPGGVVGPSQEIYYEIVRAKNETKKPFICVSTGLIASGGYYAALGCDKIVVAPGAMIGSIGVIMEFANLERLYDWAKVQRYTIKSGKFKDSGSEYRAMRDDERELFQSMIDEVYTQFKDTVKVSRNLTEDVVAQYADGRIMTGSTAVRLKFADQEGTFEDAVRVAAEAAKLGEDYKVTRPMNEREGWFEMLMDQRDDDELNTQGSNSIFSVSAWKSRAFNSSLYNKPLFLMPGYL